MIVVISPSHRDEDGSPSGAAQASDPALRSILVVEDDVDMLEVMEMMLAPLGLPIVSAGSVKEAVRAANGRNLALVISDLGLPGESGLGLLRALGLTSPTSGGSSRVPAIALSGYSAEADVRATREAGFSEHLVKPVMPDKLLDVVRRMVGR